MNVDHSAVMCGIAHGFCVLLAFAWIFSQWKSMMEELIFQTFTLHYD
jgi:hypothetical protein